MGDSYQLTDQYLYESSQKSDNFTKISKSKRVVSVSDNNQGSYQSGIITIDAATQLQGAKGFASLKDAYITLPYVVTLKNTGAGALAAALNRYCAGFKNGIWNVIDSLSVELNGQTIVNEGDYKLFYNNLRAQTEWSKSEAEKHGADSFFSMDDWVSMSNSNQSATSSGDGFLNNFTNSIATSGLTPEGSTLAQNAGFIDRIFSNPQPTAAISSGGAETGLNSNGWPTQRSGSATTIAQQLGKGCFVTTGATGAVVPAIAGQIAGTWYHMLKIRLVDLHPIFKELDLMGNPQLKLRLKVNSGYCDINVATGSMSLTSTTMTSGNTCPVMIASAASGNTMAGVVTAGTTTTLRLAFGPLQNNLTSLPTAGQYFPFTTARLYVPFYDIANISALISKPIKTVRYLDCYSQYYKARAGVGISTSQMNTAFNLQLSGSWKNIKFVCLTPFCETSTGHFATAHGTEQFASPFDSAPSTCQPGSAIRSFQVQIGNDNIFSKTVDYDYESYFDEFSKLSAINGNLTHEISNGLLDFVKWSMVNRVLVADCSRQTETDVPQSINVSGSNVCNQGSNLMIFVLHERTLSWDILTGEVVNQT